MSIAIPSRFVHSLILAGALVVLGFVPITNARSQIYRDAEVTNVSIEAGTGQRRADGVVWEHRIVGPSAGYFRIGIADVALPTVGRAVIRFSDERGATLQTLALEELAGQGVFLTDVLFGNSIAIQISGDIAEGRRLMRITKIVRQVESKGRLAPQSILPNWLGFPEQVGKQSMPLVYRSADAVVKLLFGTGFVCSGFLVGPHTILTNYHCIEKSTQFDAADALTRTRCADVLAQFDFNSQLASTRALQARCQKVVDIDESADFAVLRFEVIPLTASKESRSPLKLSNELSATPAQPVFVIHHPVGLTKKVSVQCQVYRVSETELEHDCSTTGGSSGAPILSSDGRVIGLHYAGPFRGNETVDEIEAAMAKGQVFRNKGKQAKSIVERINNVAD